MRRWWFWACPECIGTFEDSLAPDAVRCVRCGCTLAEWARRQSQDVVILQDTVATDLLYDRRAFVDLDEAFPGVYDYDPS